MGFWSSFWWNIKMFDFYPPILTSSLETEDYMGFSVLPKDTKKCCGEGVNEPPTFTLADVHSSQARFTIFVCLDA